MDTTIGLLGLALLGNVIHYLKDWNKSQQDGHEYDIKKVLAPMLLGLVTTVTIILIRDDLKTIYPITPFSAVVIGYLGDSVFFSFVDVKKPKV